MPRESTPSFSAEEWSAEPSVLYALGANVTVGYNSVLKALQDQYDQKINTMFCTKEAITNIAKTDLIINMRWPKHRKDFLIDKDAQIDGAFRARRYQ